MSEILFPGTVEWTGENPGISLKLVPDGPFVTLASFFRVVFSPHGRGHILVFLQSPSDASPPAGQENYCFYDNEPLSRYLVSNFVTNFGAFKGAESLRSMIYKPLDSVVTSGDPRSSYSETVNAGNLTIELTWRGLGSPFCFALEPHKSATGRHYMPSVFIGCEDATVSVNGRKSPGRPVAREVAGQSITTAMLAFSETWIRA